MEKIETTTEEKTEIINSYIEGVCKNGMALFIVFDLKDEIYANTINDANGDKFIFSFKKVKEFPTTPTE